MHDNFATGPIGLTTALRFQDPIPASVDVAIVGGGAIGIFAALYLNRMGLRVVVCEKGRVAGEQSSRNWGWIRKQGRDPSEIPIMMEADRLWDTVDGQVGGRTGLTRQGICYLASSEKELERHRQWLECARQHQIEARELSRSDLGRLIDQGGTSASHPWIGGVLTPTDGRAEPWQAVPAVAGLAHDEGVTIREDCAVRALNVEGGRVAGLATEAGTVRADQVVLAGGAWSSLFAGRHGIRMPQLVVRATAAKTAPLAAAYDGNAVDEKLAFRRRRDGGYTLAPADFHEHYLGPDSFRNLPKYLPVLGETLADTRLRLAAPTGFPDAWGTPRRWLEDEISPFERMRVLDPRPNGKAVLRIRRRFAERFPALGLPAIVDAWAGMIDSMPDLVPIVDRAPSLRGLIIATGMSGHGFGIAPGFGKAVANMAAGKPVGHDLTRFRFSRFSDGSRIRSGPSL